MKKSNGVFNDPINQEMVKGFLSLYKKLLEEKISIINKEDGDYDKQYKKAKNAAKLEAYKKYPGAKKCLSAHSLRAREIRLKFRTDEDDLTNEEEIGKLLFSELGGIGVSARKIKNSNQLYNGLMKGYEEIALNYDLLPTDFMVIALTGTSHSNLPTIRKRLSEKGFNFEQHQLEECGFNQENGSYYWKVTERPSNVDEITQSIDDMSKEEMAELLKVIFEKVSNHK